MSSNRFEDIDVGWDFGEEFEPNYQGPNFGGNMRNTRYNNAYGDYRGGYGPLGGFGGPPGPPLGFGPCPGPVPYFLGGSGFGGSRPPRRRSREDIAMKYLIRCGATRENVKNLPKQFLRLIEPEYCGICAQEFNSFSMSRMHYISKNHLKNQKKWLSQKSNIGNNEIPLKSRELYCELCDIQITSKQHADSHYAGKPHRAIVEGRKNAKNTLLLQQGMEARLQQLIRREKKFLKNYVEKAPAEHAVKEKPKAITPELYCDICKTSMTCTEQMTIHLNGKRHLSKEKQHILQMMKSGGTNVKEAIPEESTADDLPKESTSDDVPKESTSDDVPKESTPDDVPEESTADEDANAGEKDAEDDWGNGAETWEEIATVSQW